MWIPCCLYCLGIKNLHWIIPLRASKQNNKTASLRLCERPFMPSFHVQLVLHRVNIKDHLHIGIALFREYALFLGFEKCFYGV